MTRSRKARGSAQFSLCPANGPILTNAPNYAILKADKVAYAPKSARRRRALFCPKGGSKMKCPITFFLALLLLLLPCTMLASIPIATRYVTEKYIAYTWTRES